MVNGRGQSFMEFMVMVTVLTAAGYFIVREFAGGMPAKKTGLIQRTQEKAIEKIVQD